MNVNLLIVILAAAFTGAGLIYFVLKAHRIRDAGEKIKTKMNSYLSAKLSQEGNENILSGTHYYLNINVYHLGRFTIAFFILIFGGIFANLGFIALAVSAFLLSWPKETIFKGIKMPYYHFCRFFNNRDKEKKDRELIEGLSLLKNMMVQMQNNPVGADYIIEYLAGSASLTKSAYLKLLNQLRLNKIESAEKVFGEEVGTKLAKEMAKILVQLDQLNPIQLKETLISLQRSLRESNITVQKLRDERISDLATIPIVATIMVVFINFIIVAYIIELKTMFLYF